MKNSRELLADANNAFNAARDVFYAARAKAEPDDLAAYDTAIDVYDTAYAAYVVKNRIAYDAYVAEHNAYKVAFTAVRAAYDIAVTAYAVAIDARAKAYTAAPDVFYAADRVARKTARAARAARAKAHDAYAIVADAARAAGLDTHGEYTADPNHPTAVRTHPDARTTEHYNYDVAYAAEQNKGDTK